MNLDWTCEDSLLELEIKFRNGTEEKLPVVIHIYIEFYAIAHFFSFPFIKIDYLISCCGTFHKLDLGLFSEPSASSLDTTNQKKGAYRLEIFNLIYSDNFQRINFVEDIECSVEKM